ncbi:PRC-barrel domain-containing protein [Parasedimentitalea psychrophila]|uniref:PRC-barrel domain-containing protein n=1 Tax=Parasedimentitalea psychrophila TaxID=2997337 RepID=A0A9Y2KWR4_9RHOB|nr:PRC-barrel domain-containing protein [Parasedimentitalea psychrophila]WIY23934.1 PRC-barrel domain-containing protein [Parasedimentitalea psychrophila]
MKHKFWATAVVMSAISINVPTIVTAEAQHVAGGILLEYKDMDVAVVAGGWSVVELLRGSVYNELGDFVGYVHDAIVLPSGDTTFVIINVAGFLNIGNKLVAVPTVALGIKDNGDFVLPNATKDNLSELPSFHYARN